MKFNALTQKVEKIPTGPRGERGPRGEVGPIGPQGERGLEGPRGLSVRGPKGDRGDIGPMGMTGPQGPQGVSGVTGQQIFKVKTKPENDLGNNNDWVFNDLGEIFYKSEGAWKFFRQIDSGLSREFIKKLIAESLVGFTPGEGSGEPGASAYEVAVDNGFVGTEEQWLTSLVGPTGSAGATGSQGIQGVTGSAGIQGLVGETGPSGLQGIQGPTGTSGSQGIQGLTGSAGLTGPTGASGIAGATGASAYEVAVANGYGDTAPNWLLSLVGPTGSAGAQGLTGAAGSIGPTGASGIQGIQGIQGLTGPAGVTGATGAAGITGATGAAGANGSTGPTGPSISFVATLIGSTVSSSITHADTGLVSPTLDTGYYQWNVIGSFQSNTTASGFGARFIAGSATVSENMGSWDISQAVDGTAKYYSYSQLTDAVNVASASVVAAATKYPFFGSGWARITAQGTMKLQFRSEVGTNSNTTLSTGTSLNIVKVG